MNGLTDDQTNELMESNLLAPLRSKLLFHLIWQSHLSGELNQLWESSDFSTLTTLSSRLLVLCPAHPFRPRLAMSERP